MANKKILIVGVIVALVAWLATFLVCRVCDNNDFATTNPAATTRDQATTNAPEPSVSADDNAYDNNNEEDAYDNEDEAGADDAVAEPQLNASGKIPSPPRKAMASFTDAGEICVDAETGRMLAGRNINATCPPASVVKVMTLYVVLDALSRGEIALDDRIVASRRAYAMGGTQLYLDVGEPCVVEDLIYGLMLQSANDAAVALAERVSGSVESFVARMNATAQELGMAKTKFRSPHGLPLSKKEKAAGEKPDMTTAEDLAKLAVALLKKFPQTFKYCSTISREFPANEKRAQPFPMVNHNKLLKSFAGCDGLKTGWTNDGASIVTTASRGNKRVVAVVLGGCVKNKKGVIDAKTSQRERNQRAAELMYAGLRELDALKYEPTPYAGK
ncbi:MAG: D-alanyl-D-alanine carboxypeptidase [Opitutae bacterium]|nr:D-alanyl-D-alanine carboxypeptidase [Opitutae bacterium]